MISIRHAIGHAILWFVEPIQAKRHAELRKIDQSILEAMDGAGLLSSFPGMIKRPVQEHKK